MPGQNLTLLLVFRITHDGLFGFFGKKHVCGILFPEQICIKIIEKTVVENPVIYSFKRLGKGQMDMLGNHMIARVGTKIFL